MRGFCFLVNNEYFIVDVDLVQKVMTKMSVTPVPSSPDEVIGISNLKGRVITIFNLYRLLGQTERRSMEYSYTAVKAVIFKPIFANDDQIGLLINKPGSLIDIDDNTIRSSSMEQGADENFCISGIAEVNNKLYRIINIESIINKYKLNGGIENVEKI